MSTFQIHILAADDPFYEGECESVTVPTLDGSYRILAHHSNMIAAIVPGELRYQIPGKPLQLAAVSSGLVKVEDNDVLILVDAAERPEEIDDNRARRAADRAREALLQKKSLEEYRSAQVMLSRALNRIRVKKSSHKYN